MSTSDSLELGSTTKEDQPHRLPDCRVERYMKAWRPFVKQEAWSLSLWDLAGRMEPNIFWPVRQLHWVSGYILHCMLRATYESRAHRSMQQMPSRASSTRIYGILPPNAESSSVCHGRTSPAHTELLKISNDVMDVGSGL